MLLTLLLANAIELHDQHIDTCYLGTGALQHLKSADIGMTLHNLHPNQSETRKNRPSKLTAPSEPVTPFTNPARLSVIEQLPSQAARQDVPERPPVCSSLDPASN